MMKIGKTIHSNKQKSCNKSYFVLQLIITFSWNIKKVAHQKKVKSENWPFNIGVASHDDKECLNLKIIHGLYESHRPLSGSPPIKLKNYQPPFTSSPLLKTFKFAVRTRKERNIPSTYCHKFHTLLMPHQNHTCPWKPVV